MRFEKKIVLITGAVRNTGLAIAEAFAEAGATVVLNGRKSADVAREAARLREQYGATPLLKGNTFENRSSSLGEDEVG